MFPLAATVCSRYKPGLLLLYPEYFDRLESMIGKKVWRWKVSDFLKLVKKSLSFVIENEDIFNKGDYSFKKYSVQLLKFLRLSFPKAFALMQKDDDFEAFNEWTFILWTLVEEKDGLGLSIDDFIPFCCSLAEDIDSILLDKINLSEQTVALARGVFLCLFMDLHEVTSVFIDRGEGYSETFLKLFYGFYGTLFSKPIVTLAKKDLLKECHLCKGVHLDGFVEMAGQESLVEHIRRFMHTEELTANMIKMAEKVRELCQSEDSNVSGNAQEIRRISLGVAEDEGFADVEHDLVRSFLQALKGPEDFEEAAAAGSE